MYILGINAYHGDAAAAIVKDGKLIAAVEEERFNRVKHCAGFPAESVRYCLKTAGIGLEEVEHIGISRDPSAHLHKKVMFAAGRAAKQAAGQLAGGSGRRQGVEGSQFGVNFLGEAEAGGTPAVPVSAVPVNGKRGAKRPGIFRQVKDRLNNAAKVRDLKDDLANALGVPKSSLGGAVS